MKTRSAHPFRSEQAKAEYHDLYMERARAWPVAAETRLMDTPSGQTFVRMSGHPENPPLVLLPGSRGTSLTWIPNIAALSAHYRTYALDSIYDFGLSVRRHKIKEMRDLVSWLDEVVRVLALERPVVLAGLSYGGWLASEYTLRFPERVQQLVLLAPAMTVLPVSFTLILRALLTLISLPGSRQRFYHWLLQDAVRSGEIGRSYVDEAVADWAVAERCFSPLPLVPATVLSDEVLRDLQIPCLFMVGEHEKVYAAHKAVRRLNRVAPQIRTQIIPQAGHDLWYVQAGLVNESILRFLRESATRLNSIEKL